jgi:hypothetical protein
MDADNTVHVWDLVPGFHIGILATLNIAESHARKFDDYYYYIKVEANYQALIFVRRRWIVPHSLRAAMFRISQRQLQSTPSLPYTLALSCSSILIGPRSFRS